MMSFLTCVDIASLSVRNLKLVDNSMEQVGSERFDKEYSYAIRHNYGKEGKRTDYTPYACQKIIMSSPGVGDHHGCPYRHFSDENLRAALGKMGVNARTVDDVMDKVRNRHYQSACTLQHYNDGFQKQCEAWREGGRKKRSGHKIRAVDAEIQLVANMIVGMESNYVDSYFADLDHREHVEYLPIEVQKVKDWLQQQRTEVEVETITSQAWWMVRQRQWEENLKGRTSGVGKDPMVGNYSSKRESILEETTRLLHLAHSCKYHLKEVLIHLERAHQV
eukprot:Gb_25312 [translate_table: standard]